MHRVRSIVRAVLPALVILVVLAGVRPADVSAGKGTLAAWVEIGPDGVAFARVVTAAPACPVVRFDGRAEVMTVRAEPSAPAFPVRVCEAAVPASVRSAAVDGQSLPLPSPNLERIVVIGDTGCRLKGSADTGSFQACNDADAWPFARIAAEAARWQPDLIIHTGDYHYREAACPEGNAGCAGSPWGDTWASWDADFFTPAAPLLAAAPWVLVRGNHEICDRAGNGWFRFLEPRPMPAACEDSTEPYTLPIGEVQLLMLDSSTVNDYEIDAGQVAHYRRQFTELRAAATANAWLLTHDPLWVFGHAGEENGVEKLFQDNMNLQQASGGLLPSGLQLVLSGHIHLFESLTFDGDRPPQLVAGMSGTALDPPITTPLAGLTIDGMTVAAGTALSEFGYVTMEPDGDGWRATLRTLDGDTAVGCHLGDRMLRCEP